MENRNIKTIYGIKIGSILLYCFFVLFMILAIHGKKNMHVDEVYSYSLANSVSGIGMTIEDGKTYYPSDSPYIDFMSVDVARRFDYATVWENQATDVHPPLYYMILHTICSFFPNSFSIWFAGMINIVFAVGTLFFLRKIVFLLTENELVKRLVSVAFICSAGILSSITFLRMYTLAMFWITAFTYLIIKQIGGGHTVRRYVVIMCVTLGAALTHYYCIVYIVFCSIAFGCYLLYSRFWKGMGLFCLSEGVAAVSSVCIFPAMISHVLSSGRGNESISNFMDHSLIGFFNRLQKFFHIIDGQLFGGIFIYIFFILLLFMLIMNRNTFKRAMDEKKITIIRYACIIVPAILYFILISKIAVYTTDRYMFPIYGVLFAVVFSGISECFRMMRIQSWVYLLAILAVVMDLNSWEKIDWKYLYRDSEALLDTASEYSDVDCLLIYDATFEINPTYYEVSEYHSITYMRKDELELLSSWDISKKNHLIVMITEDDGNILEQVMDASSNWNSYDILGGYAYTNTYYLHGLH